ncbi:MAG: MotA/TolQ/ExbB proton channel family protein [Candidatus Contendobacter sp.]|nr:MotA/TolQ/ExbB proton channel family protein [Candidatus Contendobacter sp.]
MSGWWEQIGPLAGPLGLCSVLTLMLILERLLFFVALGRTLVQRLRPLLTAAHSERWSTVIEQCRKRRGLPAQGLQLLLTHRARPRDQREDILSLWLSEQQRKLHAHLKWLVLLAVVSPLLGLLGTVLGMIEAFGDLAAHVGSVHPAVLANGLQQAMLTTAVGLIIALPALIASHGFRIWADAYLALLEDLLNRAQLALDGVSDEPAPPLAADAPDRAALAEGVAA